MNTTLNRIPYHHPPPRGSTAIFDPSTLRPRRRYGSESDTADPAKRSATIMRGETGKPSDKRQWGPPPPPPPLSMAKEPPTQVFTPFKSLNGRATPVEDLYQPSMSIRCDNEVADAMRPPSRAASLYGGSVLYQPLTLTPHNSLWSNSMLYNRQPDPPGYGVNPSATMNRGSPPGGPPPGPPRFIPPQPDKDQGHCGNSNGSTTASSSPKAAVPNGGTIKKLGFAPNGYVKPEPQHPSFEFAKGGSKMFPNPIFVEGMSPFKASKRNRRGREFINRKIFEKISILHILLGLILLSLGIARLVMTSTWGLGIELVYGVYVIFTGTLGFIGSKRRHYCSWVACIVMSALSCILCIFPFVAGLMVTVPYTWPKLRKLSPELFASENEPYGVDVLLSVICVLELVVSLITATLGCSAASRFIERAKKLEKESEHQKTPEENSDISSSIQKAALKI